MLVYARMHRARAQLATTYPARYQWQGVIIITTPSSQQYTLSRWEHSPDAGEQQHSAATVSASSRRWTRRVRPDHSISDSLQTTTSPAQLLKLLAGLPVDTRNTRAVSCCRRILKLFATRDQSLLVLVAYSRNPLQINSNRRCTLVGASNTYYMNSISSSQRKLAPELKINFDSAVTPLPCTYVSVCETT